MKRYNTKKRRQEKAKWFTLFIAILVAVVTIQIAQIGIFTPLMAQTTYNGVNVPQTSLESLTEDAERTISEHIWGILTEEYELSFDEKITAMRIIDCESKFDPWAIGDNGDSLGVWQIHEPSHGDKEGYSRACSLDTYCSTRFAMKIYAKSGWFPWSCF